MMDELFFRKCWGWQNICLSIDYFHQYPERSWRLMKEIFYDFFGKPKPNAAHYALEEMEKIGLLHSIITQNIDNLHQHAGSKEVYEFHGNSRYLVYERCFRSFLAVEIDLSSLPPRCPYCKTVLKPDFVFFGEPIPETAHAQAVQETENASVFILIGTSGEIMPASSIPYKAKKNDKKILRLILSHRTIPIQSLNFFLRGKPPKSFPN